MRDSGPVRLRRCALTGLARRIPWWEPVLAGMLTISVVAQTLRPRATPFANYVFFADSLLHGHLWVDWPGPRIDAVFFNGKYFIVNDPVPGLFMLPLVKLFGLRANQTFLSVILCGVAVGAAWKLCANLGVSRRNSFWLVGFMLLGTDLWWCSSLGDVWFLAQTSAVAFTFLCLLELSGKNRGWIVALTFVLAVGSRFTMVMATPVIFYLCARGGLLGTGDVTPASIRRRLLGVSAVFVPAFALWIAYNEARWGVPWD